MSRHPCTPKSCHPWTRAQLLTLRRCWHQVAARTLARKLRPHTWCGILRMAEKLGLPRGVPQGYESIRTAADRVGVAWETLAGWLAADGVEVRCRYSPRGPTVQARWYVEPDAVDAVAHRRFCVLESMSSAAQRLHVQSAVLWHRLKIQGKLPARRRRRVSLQLPSEVYDSAMVGYRPRARSAA